MLDCQDENRQIVCSRFVDVTLRVRHLRRAIGEEVAEPIARDHDDADVDAAERERASEVSDVGKESRVTST